MRLRLLVRNLIRNCILHPFDDVGFPWLDPARCRRVELFVPGEGNDGVEIEVGVVSGCEQVRLTDFDHRIFLEENHFSGFGICPSLLIHRDFLGDFAFQGIRDLNTELCFRNRAAVGRESALLEHSADEYSVRETCDLALILDVDDPRGIRMPVRVWALLCRLLVPGDVALICRACAES